MITDRNTAPAAIILGGGRSRRYGQDKLGAPWEDSTLLDRVLAAIPAERREVILVIRQSQAPLHAAVDRIVHDDPTCPDGPLRGLVAGLRASVSEWNWVLACDLPRLRPALLRRLAQLREPGAGAVVLRSAGRPEPLMALYHRDCLPLLEQRLQKGELALHRALDDLRVRWVDDPEWRECDPEGQSFLNVNTPDDRRFDATPARSRRREP